MNDADYINMELLRRIGFRVNRVDPHTGEIVGRFVHEVTRSFTRARSPDDSLTEEEKDLLRQPKYSKIEVIKSVRNRLNLSLADCKDIVEEWLTANNVHRYSRF